MNPFQAAISAFGIATKAKLANKVASGSPEDQLRAPLDKLFQDLALALGLPAADLVGENTQGAARLDYAVTINDALVGFIEIKAPGKGADPRQFKGGHDANQWTKLKSLPNLIYTDGNAFSLWHNGELQGQIVQLDGNVESSGDKLAAPQTLEPLIYDFLTWMPTPPSTVKQLAQVSARLCRFLRDEVTDELDAGNTGLASLALEWRALLFPQATNTEFADGYAQAVTFGLLVARAKGIPLKGGIDKAALELRKSNSLIGTALRLLTDNPKTQDALSHAMRALTRVLDFVDWAVLTKGEPGAWIYFYEDFLSVYDNDLRKLTGSYYTPPPVVTAMVRLVDEALRTPALFDLPRGLASSEVTLADPAVGTGAYLLGALQSIADTVEADHGAGVVPGAIEAAVQRLIGFEMQFGPFAVAQLRLMGEVQRLTKTDSVPDIRLFITDTLGDPYTAETHLSPMTGPIGESRTRANEIKRGEPITVVIGNPPYKDKARGLGGWVEGGSPGRPSPLSLWTPPPEWGVSQHVHNTKNLYFYFWRWATWKVFGSGHSLTTGEPDMDRAGIVCFITAAGFLNGDGFQKMRDDLRRDCSDIWVVDCSPEGHRPTAQFRIFPKVQHSVCIVLAARTANKDRSEPARLHFMALPEGNRQGKFEALKTLSLDDTSWTNGPSGWRDPFLPERTGSWAKFPPIADLFVSSSPGVGAYRTWVVAPDRQSLSMRWAALQAEANNEKKRVLFHEDRDRTIDKVVHVDLGDHKTRAVTIAKDSGPLVPPVGYAFHSFDRQWIPPDHRLMSQARSDLWNSHSKNQVFATVQQAHVVSGGPAITFTDLMPDLHHYNGRGGRVFSLWRDGASTHPNIKPALIAHLSTIYAQPVSPADVLAYVAAVMAHPAFASRFEADLARPGLRLPFTADKTIFNEAAALGRRVIWLHCFGERYIDPKEGRPHSRPKLPPGEGPAIPTAGMIPSTPMPDNLSYDAANARLVVGQGYIENVPRPVFDYEVSGMNVLRQWFSYRRRDRSRPQIGDRRLPSPLGDLSPGVWLSEYTTDLLDLLHVLGSLVRLEPTQADLLKRICGGSLLTVSQLSGAGAFAGPPTVATGASKKAKGKGTADLFDIE